MADAISTSIMSQRYLLEASDMPWSMTLHFVDIASVHVLILKVIYDILFAWIFINTIILPLMNYHLVF